MVGRLPGYLSAENKVIFLAFPNLGMALRELYFSTPATRIKGFVTKHTTETIKRQRSGTNGFVNELFPCLKQLVNNFFQFRFYDEFLCVGTVHNNRYLF